MNCAPTAYLCHARAIAAHFGDAALFTALCVICAAGVIKYMNAKG